MNRFCIRFIFNIIATWYVTMVDKCSNDDGRDTTDISKCSLIAFLDHFFHFYHDVKFAFSRFEKFFYVTF